MHQCLLLVSFQEENNVEREQVEPIYIDAPVSPDSQILVADTDTIATNVVDEALEGTVDDPAVVLSGRMTLNLISPHLTELRSKSEERDSLAKALPNNDKKGQDQEIALEVSNVLLMEKFLKDAQAEE